MTEQEALHLVALLAAKEGELLLGFDALSNHPPFELDPHADHRGDDACIVSLLYVMEDGASAEIAAVGNEGIVGVTLFMGGETTTASLMIGVAAAHGDRSALLVAAVAGLVAGAMSMAAGE